MPAIELKKTDLIANKNPRMPVSLVIDTSAYLKDHASCRINIEQGLQSLLDQIKASISMTAVVDLNLICFAGEAKVTRSFGSVKEENFRVKSDADQTKVDYGSEFCLELMDGEPDISKALELMLKEQKLRVNDYELNRIKHYVPVTMVISCGKDTNSVPAATAQVNFLEKTGALSVIGILMDGGDEAELKKLTYDSNNIFTMNEMNYKQIFSMFGNSIESLSRSSANAINSLRDKMIDWKDFKRK